MLPTRVTFPQAHATAPGLVTTAFSEDDIPVKEIIDKYIEYIITIIYTLPFIMTSDT